jgi:nuclear receptor subfamily 2 group E member 1
MPKYPHEMSPPPPPPAFSLMSPYLQQRLSRENISESAARLLFMNVRWAQHVPAFSSLPYRDQLLLLEESWRELFVLSASQFNLPVEMATLIDNPSASVGILSELKNFQDAIAKFQQMNVDATEFACLRAIVLLKTSIESNGDDHRELRDQAAITSLQDQAQLTLSKYIEKAYPSQPSRFGKLLLLLPALKSVSNQAIEELFFKKTIGSIPLERIICDMYKAGTV